MTTLLDWVVRRGGVVTARDVQSYRVAGIKTVEEARRALEDLARRGYGTIERMQMRGGLRVTFTAQAQARPRRQHPVAAPTGTSFVYFIEGCASGRIKIGVAARPSARLKQLNAGQSSEPLRLLFSVPGGFAEEAALHRRFAPARTHGEWFDPTPELLGWLAEVRQW
jgi:hypothetical protein